MKQIYKNPFTRSRAGRGKRVLRKKSSRDGNRLLTEWPEDHGSQTFLEQEVFYKQSGYEARYKKAVQHRTVGIGGALELLKSQKQVKPPLACKSVGMGGNYPVLQRLRKIGVGAETPEELKGATRWGN